MELKESVLLNEETKVSRGYYMSHFRYLKSQRSRVAKERPQFMFPSCGMSVFLLLIVSSGLPGLQNTCFMLKMIDFPPKDPWIKSPITVDTD